MEELKSKPKILIADNSIENLKLLSNVLLNEGFEVIIAKSGREVLEIIQNNTPEIVLLDVGLGDIDGYDICKSLKIDKKTENIPVIFISGHILEEDILKGFESGGADYIIKPFNRSEVIARVKAQYKIGKRTKRLKEEKEQLANALSENLMKTTIINKELKKEKEKTEYYLESAKVVFIIVGKNRKIIYINMEGCNTLEYNKSEIIGKDILDFINEEKRINVEGIISGILKEDLIGINGIEFEIRNKNGEVRIIECNISIIYKEDDDIDGFIISGHDRTTEKTLEGERAKLLIDMKSKMREIECLYNVAMLAQSGKVLDSKFVDAVLKGWKNPQNISGKIVIQEKEYLSSNFEDSKIKISNNLYFNNKNIGRLDIFFDENKMAKEELESIGKKEPDFLEVLYKMLENIIAGKILEEQLINNNIQLKETQRIAKLGTWQYDIEDDKTYWYDETYNIFGIKEKENVDFSEYMEKIYLGTKDLTVEEIEELNKKENFENRIVEYKKDDNSICYAMTNAKLVYKDEKPNQIIGSILDITELKKDTKNLEKAMEDAESSNKAKTFFLANMSHEIRTPLNAIIGFSQILMRSSSYNGEEKNQLNIIVKSGEHLLSIINNILELSKIETGKTKLELEVFNVKTLIKDIVNMFSNQGREKGVNVFFNIDGKDNLSYIGDEKKIRQIYINLIGNAIKFTEKGSIEIGVKIKKSEKNRIKIESFIKDTGIGIPKSYIEKAFSRFEQAENNIWKKGGTGLGLAITKEFIELMDGSIRITSEVNNGSRFDFEFYITETEEQIDRVNSKVLNREEDGKTFRALIVDDIENNITLLKECMKVAKIDSDEARNGKKAVEMAKNKDYDIIFMDIVMPVMDGIHAIQEIRKINKKVVIVAITASVFEEEKNEVMKYGVDEFVRKPYREEQIFDILKRRLKISYKYEENSQKVIKEEEQENIENRDWMKKVPKDILEKLKDCIINGDTDGIIEQTKIINKYDNLIAIKIKKMADNYQFEKLNEMFEIE